MAALPRKLLCLIEDVLESTKSQILGTFIRIFLYYAIAFTETSHVRRMNYVGWNNKRRTDHNYLNYENISLHLLIPKRQNRKHYPEQHYSNIFVTWNQVQYYHFAVEAEEDMAKTNLLHIKNSSRFIQIAHLFKFAQKTRLCLHTISAIMLLRFLTTQ